MLEKLLSALERLGLSPEEIADAVWLARFIPDASAAGPAPKGWPSPLVGPDGALPPGRPGVPPPRSPPTESTPPVEQPGAGLRPLGAGEGTAPAGAVPLRVPGVAALPRSVALARALRPFRSSTERRGKPEVDEVATATEIAEGGLWLPHLRPARTRRFTATIVVDASATLAIWLRTVRELRLLLERMGAFRDVRVWSIHDGPGGLLVREGERGDTGPTHHPSTLVDPTGRRLILLLSDCVGGIWQQPSTASTLRRWAEAGPVAIVQPLPYRMWSRCSPAFLPVRLHRRGPSCANVDLAVCRRGAGDDAVALTGVAVPVLQLDPAWIADWAELVAGRAHTAVDGVILDTGNLPRADSNAVDPYEIESPESLVRHFRVNASPEAYLLARYLAAVPLMPPLMRLVQARMLPRSELTHLAEVFLGGLLQRAEPIRPAADDVVYQFRPGVRELLLASMRRTEIKRVLHEISAFVSSRWGAAYDFQALLTVDADTAELSPFFATVATPVLRALGGRYAELASRLPGPSAASPARQIPRPRQGGPMTRPAHPDHSALPDPDRDREPVVFEGVPPRNFRFTGREKALHELRNHLASGVTAVVPCALYGLGGVGKTQLAAEYCYRYKSQYELIWWAPAEQGALLRASLARMAPYLKLPEQEDQAQVVRAVLNALRRRQPFQHWLLVLDNAPGPDEVQEYYRYSGHVLITSRNRSWAATEGAQAVEIDVFNRNESIELLRRRLPVIAAEDAGRLADRLGDLPMALEQAAAYQLETGVSAEDYLRLLDTNPQGVLDENKAPGYDKSVQQTFRLAFSRLRNQSPAAAQLMELASFFGPEPISRRLRRAGWGVELPEPLSRVIRDDLELNRAIADLGRLSLARHHMEQGTVQIHRLVRELVQKGLDPGQRAVYQLAAQTILARANPGDVDDPGSWERLAEIAPHVRSADCSNSDVPDVRQVVLDQVRYLYAIGDYQGSWELGEPVLKAWQDRSDLGADSAETLILARHLGNSLRAIGRNSDARQLNEDTLERLRRLFGDDDVHTIVMANSFGADLRISGEYRRALQLDEETLDRHRRIFGVEDINTLRSANNHANDLRLLGRYREALDRSELIIRTAGQTVGPDHPFTYLVITNLARDLYGVGDYRGALERLEEALPRFAHRVGDKHSNVLRGVRTYGATLRKLDQLEKANAETTRILRIYRELFGGQHLDTIATTITYAKILHSMGQSHAAASRIEAARVKYLDILGRDHPYTVTAAVNLAIVLRATGEHAAAAQLDAETLPRLRESLGEDHPFTLCARASSATNAHLAGDHQTAVAISEDTWARSKTVRGPAHPNTLGCAANLALDLRTVGDTQRAEEVGAGVLEGLVRTFGPGHRDLVAVANNQRVEFDIESPAS